jgi:hypothetical protein
MHASIRCPATAETIAISLRDDRETIREGWTSSLTLKCPHCGGEHIARYRDLYVDGVLAGVGADIERLLTTSPQRS